MNTNILVNRVLLPLMLIILIFLTACNPGQSTSNESKFTFDPQKGQLERTVSDHTLVLGWEGDGSCIITILEKGSDTGYLTTIFEACTVENVVEDWKSELPSSAPAWQSEALNQFITELRRAK